MKTSPLPEGWTKGMQVVLRPMSEEESGIPGGIPEQTGLLLSDSVDNGTVCVELDWEFVNDCDDDGLREVIVEQVGKVGD